jgi:hypothetical protein
MSKTWVYFTWDGLEYNIDGIEVYSGLKCLRSVAMGINMVLIIDE